MLAGGFGFLADDDCLARPLDAPAGDRVQGGGAQRFAGAQAEAGVVQRAADRVVDQQTVGERAAVVRADRADGEDLLAPPRQQHRLVADVAE